MRQGGCFSEALGLKGKGCMTSRSFYEILQSKGLTDGKRSHWHIRNNTPVLLDYSLSFSYLSNIKH